jgi:hypothetical protein
VKLLVYGLLVGLLCLSVSVALLFHAFMVSRSEAREANRTAWHKVLCKSESAVRASDATADQKIRAIKFYDDLLVLLDAGSCS